MGFKVPSNPERSMWYYGVDIFFPSSAVVRVIKSGFCSCSGYQNGSCFCIPHLTQLAWWDHAITLVTLEVVTHICEEENGRNRISPFWGWFCSSSDWECFSCQRTLLEGLHGTLHTSVKKHFMLIAVALRRSHRNHQIEKLSFTS